MCVRYSDSSRCYQCSLDYVLEQLLRNRRNSRPGRLVEPVEHVLLLPSLAKRGEARAAGSTAAAAGTGRGAEPTTVKAEHDDNNARKDECNMMDSGEGG